MDDSEFIKKFVTAYEIEKNRYSCLIKALKDARKLTARDSETGKPNNDLLENKGSFLEPNSFIGIINYLLILDMIGEIFTNAGNTKKITMTLERYASLSQKDRDTIAALRNSLAHNYGLVNISTNGKQAQKFQLIDSNDANFIEHPSRMWMGYSDKSEDSRTKVCLGKLIDLVESVYKNLKEEVEADPFKNFALKGGIEELKSRFTIRH